MSWLVIGHDRNKRFFESVIKNGRLVHAYLFSGPEMVGKKMFARDLARLLNNKDAENNPDFRLVGSKIEDIRGLKLFLSTKPYYGPHLIAIIDDAHDLTSEASNALLKLLEEPNKAAIILLISSRPKLLLKTIYSRCQEIKFQSLGANEVDSIMPGKLKPEDKNLLKKLAQNRPGWIVRNTGKVNTIKTSIQDFNEVLNQGIFEKMQYASKIYDKEDTGELIGNLIYWHYSQEPKPLKLLKNLIALSNIISQPQYNHRLALESFLINL